MKDIGKEFAVWRVVDKHDNVISFGIDDFPTEFDLGHLPDGYDGDRNIKDVQKEMKKNSDLWIKEGYKFEYKIYYLYDDLEIEKDD